MNGLFQKDVARRSTSHECVRSAVYYPAAVKGVPRCKLSAGNVHTECLAGAWIKESSLTEGLELLCRLGHMGVRRSGDINLNALFTCHLAGILHGHRDIKSVTSRSDRKRGIAEGSIAEAIAEGIERLHAKRIKVPVTHEDILVIADLGHIPVGIREVGGRRIILILRRHGERQFAGRIHLAGKDIGHGVSGFLAGQPGMQDGVRKLVPESHVDDIAHVQENYHLLPV